jgi:hypothetical protein
MDAFAPTENRDTVMAIFIKHDIPAVRVVQKEGHQPAVLVCITEQDGDDLTSPATRAQPDGDQ